MANKKCNYCRQTMNRVVWGMPTIEEMENPKPMTEYSGCIIGPDTPKWHCEVCGSSVIPTLHPKSGICLHEAPVEVRQAIKMLAMRIEQFAGDFDLGGPPIEIFCPGFDSEWLDGETIDNHAQHGDCFRITVCGCQSFDVFFDGFGVSSDIELGRTSAGYLEELDRGNFFELDSLRISPSRLPDLMFGSKAMAELVETIGESKMVGCRRDFICETSRNWELLADYWVEHDDLFPNRWLYKTQQEE